jgi:hypothetical protein
LKKLFFILFVPVAVLSLKGKYELPPLPVTPLALAPSLTSVVKKLLVFGAAFPESSYE